MTEYVVGEIEARDGGRHPVLLGLLPAIGNNSAASRATLLLEQFPTVTSLLMVGIAGGAPNPRNPEEHVRLGDIVVSNQQGIIQYDYVKETISDMQIRNPPRPPSAQLLEAVRRLEAEELLGERPWVKNIERAAGLRGGARPPEQTDQLAATPPDTGFVAHPEDRDRNPGEPRVFHGSIGSANILLKNAVKRDSIRDKFGTRAFEMEGSGIADASWSYQVGYLVIRGICDYCDQNKNNTWQVYAAIVAAAYARSVISRIPTAAVRAYESDPKSNSSPVVPIQGKSLVSVPDLNLDIKTATRRDLRVAIHKAIPRSEQFLTFVMTYFPAVAREYTTGMDRTTQTNMLFESIEEEPIAAALLDFMSIIGTI